jgi:hypothetical protein
MLLNGKVRLIRSWTQGKAVASKTQQVLLALEIIMLFFKLRFGVHLGG